MNELAPIHDNGGLDVLTLGRVFRDSGYFKDATGEAQAIVKIFAGREMGIPAFAAMTGIHIIQGKPEIGAHLLARLVKESPKYDYRIIEHTDETCSIRFLERIGDDWDVLGVSTFTMADAKRAGLLSNATWGKYPRPMLFSRAMSNGVSMMCPDVTGGSRVYAEGEISEATQANGNGHVEVIETRITATTAEEKAAQNAVTDAEREAFSAVVARCDTTMDDFNSWVEREHGYETWDAIPDKATRVEVYKAARLVAEQREQQSEGQEA